MPEAEGAGQSSADDLIKNLRALIVEEVQKPAPPAGVQPDLPSWKDGLWLAVLVADAALLSYWIPEGAKGPFEFLKTLLPWLLGGTFVVLNNWFRDHLLSWSRRRLVRVFEVTFLVVGIMAGVPIIPIKPEVNPAGTILTIGEDKEAKQQPTGEKLWLMLRARHIKLSAGVDDPYKEPREFDLGLARLAWAAVTSHGLDWRRVYRVDIDTPIKAKIAIVSKQGGFDFDFLDKKNLQKWQLQSEHIDPRKYGLTENAEKEAIVFQSSGSEESNPMVLPWGTYWIGMEGCKTEDLEIKALERNYLQVQPCKKL
jgi:hypothetical protein